MVDCDKYQGRKRDICRGHDDTGKPIKLSPTKRKAYLQRWGDDDDNKAESQVAWISWIKTFRRTGDKGVGDTVERMTAIVGGRLVKRAMRKLGITCGCDDRQAELNRLHPYD